MPEEALNHILATLGDLYSEGKWQMDHALAWGSDEAKTAAFFNMVCTLATHNAIN